MITNDYLLKLKKIVDSLFSIGSTISEAYHIEAVLEFILMRRMTNMHKRILFWVAWWEK